MFNFIGTKGTAPYSNEGIGGSSYLSFTSVSSPFYISGTLNFEQYLINNSLATSCSFSKDAFANNYDVLFDKVYYMLNIRDIHKYFVAAFDNASYNSNVVLADTGYRVDRINSYPSDNVAISQYNSVTEKRYINAVHPSTVGGAEIAIVYSNVIRSLL